MRVRLAFLLGGVLLGIGAVLGVLGLRTLVDDWQEPYSRTDPSVVVWTCAGARVVTSIVLHDGTVLVQNTLEDERGRRWELEWVGYHDGGDLVPDAAGGYAVPVGVLTDLDDGPERTVALRPAGAARWCRQAVTLR